MDAQPLERLLEHPAIWRGRSVAHVESLSTGFAALDEALPGQGWPRAGLIEILTGQVGSGEQYLLLPLLAALTQCASARWCAWITPPFEPYAPALVAHGVALDRVFVARGSSSSWAFEQALVSGACDVVFGWSLPLRAKDIRRLHLAAGKGRTLGVLFRSREAANESSGAMLRLVVEPAEQGTRVTLLKSRGGHRGSIVLNLSSPVHGST
jgi:cell division inhibitor SulA